MQQQYLANLQDDRMPGGGCRCRPMAPHQAVRDCSAVLANLQKMMTIPAAPDGRADGRDTQFTDLQQQYVANLQKMTASPAALPEFRRRWRRHEAIRRLQQQYLRPCRHGRRVAGARVSRRRRAGRRQAIRRRCMEQGPALRRRAQDVPRATPTSSKRRSTRRRSTNARRASFASRAASSSMR